MMQLNNFSFFENQGFSYNILTKQYLELNIYSLTLNIYYKDYIIFKETLLGEDTNIILHKLYNNFISFYFEKRDILLNPILFKYFYNKHDFILSPDEQLNETFSQLLTFFEDNTFKPLLNNNNNETQFLLQKYSNIYPNISLPFSNFDNNTTEYQNIVSQLILNDHIVYTDNNFQDNICNNIPQIFAKLIISDISSVETININEYIPNTNKYLQYLSNNKYTFSSFNISNNKIPGILNILTNKITGESYANIFASLNIKENILNGLKSFTYFILDTINTRDPNFKSNKTDINEVPKLTKYNILSYIPDNLFTLANTTNSYLSKSNVYIKTKPSDNDYIDLIQKHHLNIYYYIFNNALEKSIVCFLSPDLKININKLKFIFTECNLTDEINAIIALYNFCENIFAKDFNLMKETQQLAVKLTPRTSQFIFNDWFNIIPQNHLFNDIKLITIFIDLITNKTVFLPVCLNSYNSNYYKYSQIYNKTLSGQYFPKEIEKLYEFYNLPIIKSYDYILNRIYLINNLFIQPLLTINDIFN